VTWRIVPAIQGELLQDKNGEKSRRPMEAMLKMVKLDIADSSARMRGDSGKRGVVARLMLAHARLLRESGERC
jgi:hypothetical protein